MASETALKPARTILAQVCNMAPTHENHLKFQDVEFSAVLFKLNTSYQKFEEWNLKVFDLFYISPKYELSIITFR